MIDSSIPQALQLVAWFCALIELIMGLYMLVFNARRSANWHGAVFLIVAAVNVLGMGILVGATNAREGTPGTWLLSACTAAMPLWTILAAVVLLRPAWLLGKRRWLGWLFYVLSLLPALLTLIDVTAGTGLYYTGLDSQTFGGGSVSHEFYAAGPLSKPLWVLSTYILNLVPVLLGVYVLFRDLNLVGARPQRTQSAVAAVIITSSSLMAFAGTVFLPRLLGPATTLLLANVILVAGYGFAVFRQVIAARKHPSGHLRVRLAALSLVVTIPVLVGALLFANTRITGLLRERAAQELETANRALAASITTWFDTNTRTLSQLAVAPDVASMDPARQEPVLKVMAAANLDIQLISTVGWDGMNVARSDGAEAKNYGNETWFFDIRAGTPLVSQVLISRMSGKPSLIVAVPMRNIREEPVGACMLWTELTAVSEQVQASRAGRAGFAYLVDEQNDILTHSDPNYTHVTREERNAWPAIVALRSESLAPGTPRQVRFSDDRGGWLAYVSRLENGWGLVVQQPESDISTAHTLVLAVLGGLLGIGAIMLISLLLLTVRQTMWSIHALTEAASAVAQGDLDVTADVEGEDEIGQLAETFNDMTDRLRGRIDVLDTNVHEQTNALERRSRCLLAAAEIGHAAASTPDTDELLHAVVDLIYKQLGLDYIGLFLVDEMRQWAVLRACTGTAEQQMLAQGERLRIDRTSIVGRCVMSGEAEIPPAEQAVGALQHSTLLSGSHLEWAFPLVIRGNVMGAMVVQNRGAAALDQTYVAALEIVTSQVALVIENRRLAGEAREAQEATRRAAGERTQQSWAELLQTRRHWGYQYVRGHTAELSEEQIASSETLAPAGADDTLALPLQVRDQVVGRLYFRKDRGQAWSAREQQVLELLVAQMGDALVGAQLYQAAQANAAREQVVGDLATRMRQTLDVESVLRTAVEEVRRALDLPEVVIRLQTPPEA